MTDELGSSVTHYVVAGIGTDVYYPSALRSSGLRYPETELTRRYSRVVYGATAEEVREFLETNPSTRYHIIDATSVVTGSEIGGFNV